MRFTSILFHGTRVISLLPPKLKALVSSVLMWRENINVRETGVFFRNNVFSIWTMAPIGRLGIFLAPVHYTVVT